MIRRLDARLIALHQWVVDATQASPMSLARQCCVLGFTATLVRWAALGATSWAAAVVMGACVILFILTLSPPLFRFVGAEFWLRCFFVAGVAVDAVILAAALILRAPSDTVARFSLACLSDLAVASFYYFAACQPPRPRVPRPRGRLVHGGAL
jgi:hypothetical protein